MTDKELFDRVRELLNGDWQTLPTGKGWGGTGAPGKFLEILLGLDSDSSDTPDSGRWEVKFTSGNALLTLFHKTPRPKGSMKYMVNKFGWIGKNNRQSFRHTIEGSSEKGFNIAADSGSVWVRHPDHNGPVPYWTFDDLLNIAGGKLRRLLLVRGEKSKGRVLYKSAWKFEELKHTKLIQAIETGLVAVDFDAYIKPSGAVRDHGVKFRVRTENLRTLYSKSSRIQRR
ncbi:MAG: MvaI/BcnI family restriction endonuclease [Candidatus Dadabacteria bacterium]|nr:MvaI/BcnI family restriction endonuclease [Candidatus Dadabacteria bacterium]